MAQRLIGIFHGVARILQIGGIAVLAFMAISVTYDALMRYVFAAPTSWSLEINSFLIVYLALMTAADVQARGQHIGITILQDASGPAMRRVLTSLVSLVGIAFCSILAWRGGVMSFDAWSYGERVSSAFGTPNWIPYAMLPIGFGMLGLQFLINLFVPPRRQDGTHTVV